MSEAEPLTGAGKGVTRGCVRGAARVAEEVLFVWWGAVVCIVLVAVLLLYDVTVCGGGWEGGWGV